MSFTITDRQLLARVVDKRGGADLRGYVEGQNVWRVKPGAEGRFVADAQWSALKAGATRIGDDTGRVSRHGATSSKALAASACRHVLKPVPAQSRNRSSPLS